MSESAAADLRRIVLEQTRAEVGIPVLLFTTASLTDPDPDPEPNEALEEVTETAIRLGLDLDDLPLFSSDAYLLQSALGESASRGRR